MGVKITRKNNLEPTQYTYEHEPMTLKRIGKSFIVFIFICIGACAWWVYLENLEVNDNSSIAVKILKSEEYMPDPIAETKEELEETKIALATKDDEYLTTIKDKDRVISFLTSRGGDRAKTKPILDYTKLSCPAYLVMLMEYMSEQHEFPDISTAYCIIKYESNFNPSCHTVTKKEDSRGLLQVNVFAHSKRIPNKNNLFDSAYNLDFQLDELKIYYDIATKKGLKGAERICYVSRWGQRCQWKQWIADSIKKTYKEYLAAVIKE